MEDWLEIFEGNAAAARDLASELHTQAFGRSWTTEKGQS
jgi:hypothetical protein